MRLPVEFDGEPQIYVFALVQDFSMHSFSAAVEPLRIANQLTGKQLFHWQTRSLDGLPVVASNGLSVSSDGAFEDLPKGATLIACSGDDPVNQTPKELTGWLRSTWRRGHIVGGLCTGAHALCQAGILHGHKFTLHWECQPVFSELHPDLDPDPAAFVVDQRIVTSGGGVGSTDLMLHLIEERFGRRLRYAVADMCLQVHVRGPEGMQRSLAAITFGVQDPKFVRAINYLHSNLQEGLEMDEWAAHLRISRRQLERIFKRHTGLSPKKFETNLRLEHAYSLLFGTNMTLIDIAAATGLSSRNLGRAFKERYGIRPQTLARQI